MNSIDEAFSSVKQYCRKEGRISEAAMKLWIDIMKPVQLDGSVAVFTVQSEFQKTVVMNTYNALLKEAFLNVLGLDVKIQINVVTPEENDNPLSENSNAKDYDELARRHEELEHSFEGANYEYTFATFIVGGSNEFAYAACTAVAKEPGKNYNPLFIYGKSGLGKTHLMFAIQNYIRETQPHLRTVYVDSSDLLTDYMEAGAAHDKEKSSYKNFKSRYEEADVLLIDDIQYLQGKKQTLDIVFQIFNSLINQSKQIILSADRAPKNIDIDERYHSRFSQGGLVDIQPPEIETKLGIVKSFIDEYCRTEGLEHFSIPQDVQMYIAENSSSNIRELKGAVTKVIYQMTFSQQPNFTVSDARSLLENHFSGGASRNLSIDDIQKEIESYFKIKHSDLVGKSRARQVNYPRQLAMYLCRQILDVPYNEIGKKFNRDHSTVMHAVTQVEKSLQEKREVQEEVEVLTQIIREI